MFECRKRIATPAVALAGLSCLVAVNVAGPAQADPDIGTVKERVNRLYHQAEQASERYNAAKEDLHRAQKRLRGLRSDVSRQRHDVGGLRQQVATMMVEQYQTGDLSQTGQMVLSENPQAFLENLNTVDTANTQQAQTISAYTRELRQLRERKHAVSAKVADLARTKRKMARDKAQIDEKAAAAQDLLDRLKAEQRRRLAAQAAARSADGNGSSSSASAPSPAPAPSAASGSAQQAVSYAMAQVGKAYVYGAAGPDAFDCSGLTMAAWSSAGVGLPHNAAGQYAAIPHVSTSALQPGDLVFYFSGISHVGMYIGNGQVVSALNPSQGIMVHPLNMMPVVGAGRPG